MESCSGVGTFAAVVRALLLHINRGASTRTNLTTPPLYSNTCKNTCKHPHPPEYPTVRRYYSIGSVIQQHIHIFKDAKKRCRAVRRRTLEETQPAGCRRVAAPWRWVSHRCGGKWGGCNPSRDAGVCGCAYSKGLMQSTMLMCQTWGPASMLGNRGLC